ncbi:hypothetical protein KAR91_06860 [Candidatus Pacearchaeota archaeon]|nr:hypothetical protein [Candidatus Pacearchaeota archaeon]
MLENSGTDPDTIDLEAIVDEELTLHENIENIENALGSNVITGDQGNPEEEQESYHRKLLEDGTLEPYIMKNQWLEIVLPGTLNLIPGGKRRGKSVLAYWLLELLHEKHGLNAYVYGLPEEKWHLIPEFADPLTTLDLPENSVILFDEAYMKFHSRTPGAESNKQIDIIAGLVGQKNIIGLYITQQTRKLDVGIVGACDTLLFKKPSLLQMLFDRRELRAIIKKVYNEFKQFSGDDIVKNTYVISEDFEGFLTNPKPAWWTEELSTAYKGVSVAIKDKKEPDSMEDIKCYYCDEDAIDIKDGTSVCAGHLTIKDDKSGGT